MSSTELPRVSVVIRSYERGPYVIELIETVLRQRDVPPFEIVVVEQSRRLAAADAARLAELAMHTRVRLIDLLSEASGTAGMAGGQALDLAAVGRQLNVSELEEMHTRKTGALIRASVLMPALTQQIDPQRYAVLDRFARYIGLAFQVQDDILDVEGDPATVGKPTGADSAKDKPTYPSVIGLEASKRRCRELHALAIESLGDFGPGADNLRWLADFVIERDS